MAAVLEFVELRSCMLVPMSEWIFAFCLGETPFFEVGVLGLILYSFCSRSEDTRRERQKTSVPVQAQLYKPNPLWAPTFLLGHGVFAKKSEHIERAFMLSALSCVYLWA